jgi:hypothetical protein
MRVAHREHFPGTAIGWGPAMNLFSLIFVLILAVLFTIVLLLFFSAMERKAPPAAPEPHRAAELRVHVRS